MSDLKAYVLVGLITFAVVFVLVVVIYMWQNKKDFAAQRRFTYPPPNDVYLGLRNQMLTGSRTKFSLAATSAPTELWGIVMDWGVANGTATVVALSDGSASLYTSSGGGSIGGQSRESIRNVAQKAVTTAAEFQAQAHLTTTYPLPTRGGVIFYFLTDAGVFTAAAPESELRTHKHRLSKLGDAMQEIVTQYRLTQQTR
jgi:hypothetical protein